MTETFLAALVGGIIFGGAMWILGWHFGARTLRNRHQKLIKLLEENTKGLRIRNRRAEGEYARGISDTLTAFEMFLRKFKE